MRRAISGPQAHPGGSDFRCARRAANAPGPPRRTTTTALYPFHSLRDAEGDFMAVSRGARRASKKRGVKLTYIYPDELTISSRRSRRRSRSKRTVFRYVSCREGAAYVDVACGKGSRDTGRCFETRTIIVRCQTGTVGYRLGDLDARKSHGKSDGDR